MAQERQGEKEAREQLGDYSSRDGGTTGVGRRQYKRGDPPPVYESGQSASDYLAEKALWEAAQSGADVVEPTPAPTPTPTPSPRSPLQVGATREAGAPPVKPKAPLLQPMGPMPSKDDLNEFGKPKYLGPDGQLSLDGASRLNQDMKKWKAANPAGATSPSTPDAGTQAKALKARE